MVEVHDAVQPKRMRGIVLTLLLVGIAAFITLLGALYAINSSHSAAPALPAAPPGAVQLKMRQTTDMLDGNQILTLGLYRVPATPSAVIAFYRRLIGASGGSIGRFKIVVTSAAPEAVPTALQHLPTAFASSVGAAARTRYTFTEYMRGSDDVGIAIDLRHSKGPTLVFVEMLS